MSETSAPDALMVNVSIGVWKGRKQRAVEGIHVDVAVC